MPTDDERYETPDDIAIGRAVGDARERAAMSQADAGSFLGIGQSRIARIESGSRRLLFSEALAFAHLYGCSLADFDPRTRERLPRRGVRRRRIAVRKPA